MKKQQLNKILAALLVVIWGVLIYKYVSPYLKQQNPQFKVEQIKTENLYKSFQKDTFELKISKKDPFLNNSYHKKKSPIYKLKPNKGKKSVNNNKVWPIVSYLGFVKSNANKYRLGLVRVDNKLYKVHKGEKLKSLEIVSIKEDSIQLKFSGQIKYFKR